MDQILNAGININLFFQGLGGWLKTPMELLSFLGSEYFFMAVIPAIYWCWSTALGIRIGLLLMISSSLNSVFKLLFHQPRPYWYDLRVSGMAEESSFGLPSGHAQNAVVVWGGIAAWIRRPWAWIVATLLILSIGLSRIYLGVHFPTDVLAGWLIGIVILVVYLLLENPVKMWLRDQSLGVQILVAFLGSLLLILLTALARTTLGAFTVPQTWVENARHAFPESEPINPLSISDVYGTAGVLFGLALGLALLNRQGGLDPSGPWWQRLVRYLLGLIGIGVLYVGLKQFLPDGEDFVANLMRYFRYGLVGLWVTWLAPLLFIALKLAKRQNVN
jgi:membrane-associated phospholipid phosphatase